MIYFFAIKIVSKVSIMTSIYEYKLFILSYSFGIKLYLKLLYQIVHFFGKIVYKISLELIVLLYLIHDITL